MCTYFFNHPVNRFNTGYLGDGNNLPITWSKFKVFRLTVSYLCPPTYTTDYINANLLYWHTCFFPELSIWFFSWSCSLCFLVCNFKNPARKIFVLQLMTVAAAQSQGPSSVFKRSLCTKSQLLPCVANFWSQISQLNGFLLCIRRWNLKLLRHWKPLPHVLHKCLNLPKIKTNFQWEILKIIKLLLFNYRYVLQRVSLDQSLTENPSSKIYKCMRQMLLDLYSQRFCITTK